MANTPERHHLDKRAGDTAGRLSDGDPDDMLDTKVVAKMLSVSTQWLEIGRVKGYGPPFHRLSVRSIKYRRSAVIEWLRAREFLSTREYAA